jgi:hypothetical protein
MEYKDKDFRDFIKGYEVLKDSGKIGELMVLRPVVFNKKLLNKGYITKEIAKERGLSPDNCLYKTS